MLVVFPDCMGSNPEVKLIMPRLFYSIDSSVEIRPDRPDDELTLRRLAQLDSARPLPAPRLLALVDGQPLAAISLRDRAVIADPFAHTAHLVALLRERAEHVWPHERATGGGHRGRPAWRLRPL
jgi:hypothetical protein